MKFSKLQCTPVGKQRDSQTQKENATTSQQELCRTDPHRNHGILRFVHEVIKQHHAPLKLQRLVQLKPMRKINK